MAVGSKPCRRGRDRRRLRLQRRQKPSRHACYRDGQYAGLGLVAAGLISKVISASTVPAADTRSWDNLPLYLAFAAFELPPGQHTATIDFLDAQNRKIGGLTRTVTFEITQGSDKVIYASDRSS